MVKITLKGTVTAHPLLVVETRLARNLLLASLALDQQQIS